MKFLAGIGSFLIGVIIGIVLVVGGVAGAGALILTRPGMVGVVAEKVPGFEPADEIKEKSLLEYGQNIYSVISSLESQNIGQVEDAIGLDLSGMISEAIGISKDELRQASVSGEGIINTVMDSETFTIGVLLEKFGITLPDMPLFQNEEFKKQSIQNAFTYISDKLDFDKMTVGDLETEFGVSLGEMFSSETLKNSTLSSIGDTLKIVELHELLDITTVRDSDEYVSTHVKTDAELTAWKTGKTAYTDGTEISYVYNAGGTCNFYFNTVEEQSAYLDQINEGKTDEGKACEIWEFFEKNNNLYLALRSYFTEKDKTKVDYDALRTWLVGKKYYTSTDASALTDEQVFSAVFEKFPTFVAPVVPEIVETSVYEDSLQKLTAAEKQTNTALKYLYNAKIGADSSDPQSINGIMNDIRVSDVTEITAESPKILQNLAGLKVSELGGSKTTEVINGTLIKDVLGIDKADSQVLQYFIDNNVTVGGMDTAITEMTLKDVTVIDENSHNILKKLKDSKINEIAAEMTDVVNKSSLYELVTIETDKTVEYYKARFVATEAEVSTWKEGKTAYSDGVEVFDYFETKDAQTAWINAEKEKGNTYYDRYEICTKTLVFSTEVERKSRYVELWLANKNSTNVASAESAYDGLTAEQKDEFGLVITEDQYAKPYAPTVKEGYAVPTVSNKTLVYLYYSKIGSNGVDGLNAYMNAMKLSDVMDIKSTDNAILVKVKDDKINDLSTAITDAVKTTTVGEILGGDKTSQSKVLQYLWDSNLSDDATNGLNAKISNMTLGDAVDIPGYVKATSGAYVYDESIGDYREKKTNGTDDSLETYARESGFNIVMWKLNSTKVTEIGNKMQETINTTKLGELITIETDSTKSNYNAVLYKLKDTEVQNLSGDLNTAINDTTIGEIITISDTSPNILKALKNTKMSEMSTKIDTLTLAEVFGEDKTKSGALSLIEPTTTINGIPDAMTTAIKEKTLGELYNAGLLGSISSDDWTYLQEKGLDKMNINQVINELIKLLRAADKVITPTT